MADSKYYEPSTWASSEKIDEETKQKEGEQEMSKTVQIYNNLKNVNTDAADMALKLEVGQAGNKIVKGQLLAAMPSLSSILDTEFGDMIVAELATTLVASFASENEYAGVITEAMLVVGMSRALGVLNLPELANNLVESIGVGKIKQLMGAKKVEE